MTDRIPCEFFLIRYVPDVVKGEFVNIGVLLREATASNGDTLLRFTRDWSRVRCIDPDADIALLEGLEAEIAARLLSEKLHGHPAGSSRPLLAALSDSLSNSIQITEPHACLAESRALELEQLMRLYVEPIKVKQTRTRTGRAAIAAAMRSAFERAGVWQSELMRKRISAALYTRPGDPMRLDCGYRPNGVIRIFHAVSLATDVEAAKGLAYSAPRLRDGFQRIESATLELTAVVEQIREVAPEDAARDTYESEASERYGFGVETMQLEHIRVLPVSRMTDAAETARMELGL